MTDSPRAPRADVERNRRTLLDAAIGVLMEEPGASMDDVARGAGLTRATLYRHFGSREHLLDAIRGEALAQARKALEAAQLDEGGSIEALSRFIRAATTRGGRFRFLLAGGAGLDSSFVRQRGKVLEPLRDVVRRGQAAGELRSDLPTDWAVTALVALLTAGVGHPDRTEDGSAELIVATLLRGIAGPCLEVPPGLHGVGASRSRGVPVRTEPQVPRRFGRAGQMPLPDGPPPT